MPGQGCLLRRRAPCCGRMVTGAAGQARDEAGFFARLREGGVLVRLRFSEMNPGQVTGYCGRRCPAIPGRTGAPCGTAAGGWPPG